MLDCAIIDHSESLVGAAFACPRLRTPFRISGLLWNLFRIPMALKCEA
jgi:hypothetical protein